MNKKSWLIVGLSLAMAASIGVGISACGEKEPDTPPTPEHTHSYTEWEHSDTQHWMICPDDDAIWEQGKVDHTFKDGKCECGYQKPEIYLTGHIASQPGSEFPEVWDKQGKNVLEEVRANCIKMELGADGKTYEAEVLLSTNDRFRVYDAVKGISYPGTVVNITGLAVEEDNGYIVSWEKGKTPTWKVHDHDFTAYDKDENQHWKVCTLDGTVEPGVEKQDHDFTNGDCVCGQKAPEGCKHENGFAFSYEALPECNAEGGTLQKTCPDCLGTEDVHYDQGIVGSINAPYKPSKQTEITEDGNYYLTGLSGLKFKFEKAGTLRVALDGIVYKLLAWDVRFSYLCIANKLPLSVKAGVAGTAIAASTTCDESILTKYDVTIDGYQSGVTTKPFKSISITIDEDDLANGALWVSIGFSATTGPSASADETNFGYLATISGISAAAATAIHAPAEVALLPEKKD